MSRKPIIAGNWKMNLLQSDARALYEGISSFVSNYSAVQLPSVVIAPVFTCLNQVKEIPCDCGCNGTKLAVAAQNCHWESSGAYTGEISVEMAKDAGCSYIIIGHSERRQYFSETDEMINKKAKAIASQIRAALDGISSEDVAKSVIAYEPIWAIGTGKSCDAAEANRVIKMIRGVVADVAGQSAADSIRILYGGSVKPSTIEEQMAQSDIDGALIGGASLKADSFNEIIEKTMKVAV